MIETPIKTGICAFGMSGRVFHAPLIHYSKNFELTHILERSRNESALLYPKSITVKNFDDIVCNAQIDLVIVNTPNAFHYPMTKTLLEAGKHVVVEKPFTVTTSEGKKLIDIAHSKGRILSVFHNKRYESDFLAVREFLTRSDIGKLKQVNIRFDRYRPEIGPKAWKENPLPGAGMLYDLGSHLIDQALALFGKPNTIDADLQIQRENGKVIDYFEIKLTYDSFTVHLSSSFLQKAPREKYLIKTDKGTFTKNGNDPQEAQLKNGLLPNDIRWGLEDSHQWGKFIPQKGKEEVIPSHKGKYESFYSDLGNAILSKSQTPILPEEGLDVISIIEKSIESNRLKKTISFD